VRALQGGLGAGTRMVGVSPSSGGTKGPASRGYGRTWVRNSILMVDQEAAF
jgi:hypothetical protein